MRLLIQRARNFRKPNALAFAVHVAQKLGTLTIGRVFVSPYGQKLRQIMAKRSSGPNISGLKLAVVVHAYYPELLPEALACLALLPPETSFLVTVPHERSADVRDILANVVNARVFEVPNRGRDVAPFIDLLNRGALDGYDAVLKLHTKRSPHLRDGDIRRRLLYLMLCGERNATARALASFNDPTVGMVGWRACFRTAPLYWMKNKLRVATLAERMRAADSARLGFFEGTMFWYRPKALEPLRKLGIDTVDFEPELGQTDGALHHAIERCFTIAAWSGGYTVRDLKGRLLTGSDVSWEGAELATPAIMKRPADRSAL